MTTVYLEIRGAVPAGPEPEHFGSEAVRWLIDELEAAHCVCNAADPARAHFPPCPIHERCRRLRVAFKQSGPEN